MVAEASVPASPSFPAENTFAMRVANGVAKWVDACKDKIDSFPRVSRSLISNHAPVAGFDSVWRAFHSSTWVESKESPKTTTPIPQVGFELAADCVNILPSVTPIFTGDSMSSGQGVTKVPKAKGRGNIRNPTVGRESPGIISSEQSSSGVFSALPSWWQGQLWVDTVSSAAQHAHNFCGMLSENMPFSFGKTWHQPVHVHSTTPVQTIHRHPLSVRTSGLSENLMANEKLIAAQQSMDLQTLRIEVEAVLSRVKHKKYFFEKLKRHFSKPYSRPKKRQPTKKILESTVPQIEPEDTDSQDPTQIGGLHFATIQEIEKRENVSRHGGSCVDAPSLSLPPANISHVPAHSEVPREMRQAQHTGTQTDTQEEHVESAQSSADCTGLQIPPDYTAEKREPQSHVADCNGKIICQTQINTQEFHRVWADSEKKAQISTLAMTTGAMVPKIHLPECFGIEGRYMHSGTPPVQCK